MPILDPPGDWVHDGPQLDLEVVDEDRGAARVVAVWDHLVGGNRRVAGPRRLRGRSLGCGYDERREATLTFDERLGSLLAKLALPSFSGFRFGLTATHLGVGRGVGWFRPRDRATVEPIPHRLLALDRFIKGAVVPMRDELSGAERLHESGERGRLSPAHHTQGCSRVAGFGSRLSVTPI